MTAKKPLLSRALCKTKWKPEIFVVQSPEAHEVSCNRGGVERRHAALGAREPGGHVDSTRERQSGTQQPLPHGA